MRKCAMISPNVIPDWPIQSQSGHSKHRLRPLRDVLRDCNNLKLLTGCTDYRVRFVLSHDTIFLYAPIVAPEGHRAPKGNGVS
jgi:hypothetical protein